MNALQPNLSATVPAPQANVESSDVWGESSPQYPLVPESVAGASTYPLCRPYPIQTPTFTLTYGGVAHPQAPMYGGSESSSTQQTVPSAQTYVPTLSMRIKRLWLR